jgi:membrane protein YdbS with pleckstrin-like domain
MNDDAQRDGRDETAAERADRNWDELMQELRVMQTGTQILTGFLLAVAFQPLFADLDDVQRTLYVALVLLAAAATVLALAPVGLHRFLFAHRLKPQLVTVAGRLVKANLVVIGAVTVGVTAFILDIALSRTVAIVVALIGLVVVVLLWVVLPLRLMTRARRVEDDTNDVQRERPKV